MCPCRWLDRKEDDGAIERDLFPSASIVGATHWKLTVVTGDESGAGTDANVFCMLRGDKAAFGPHQLTAQKVGGYHLKQWPMAPWPLAVQDTPLLSYVMIRCTSRLPCLLPQGAAGARRVCI